jgi:hypothetical protein
MPSLIIATSALAIVVVLVVLVAALLAGLAFTMSRTARLRPHRPGVTGNRWGLRRRRWQARAAEREEQRKARQ